MKILSWNVNGLRAVLKKGFLDFLKKEKPDILALQEIKIAEAARKKELSQVLSPVKLGYDLFWHSAKRPGYSGTLTLIKHGLIGEYLPFLKWDDEGRIQVLSLPQFYFVNVYFPNANHELSRLDFKINFNNKLLSYLNKLKKDKPIIICGDFNVAHQEIDLARPKQNIGNPGFTNEERDWMSKFLKKGFIDTFRQQHPKKIAYSWWSYRFGARAKNIGWRIDYFCVSEKIMPKVKESFILSNILGSDHCPVGIKLK